MKNAILATSAAIVIAVLLSSPTFAQAPDRTPNEPATSARPLHSTQADNPPF